MSDVVVTVPQARWSEWIEEGDPAGERWSEEWEYSFYVFSAPPIKPGERVYIVAHGKLRGYSPLVRIDQTPSGFALVRHGEAVAVTVPEPIRGFRGWRERWWKREDERPFPDWRAP